jgi:hypothetical protein
MGSEPVGRHQTTCETMNKKRIEGRREDDELAPHSEVAGSCLGGKSDVCAGKQCVVRLAARPGLSPYGARNLPGDGAKRRWPAV